MIFTSLYGIVDGYFVSNYAGSTAFASLNLVMPFIMLLGGVGFMFGCLGFIIAPNVVTLLGVDGLWAVTFGVEIIGFILTVTYLLRNGKRYGYRK